MSNVKYYLRKTANSKVAKIYCYTSWPADYVRVNTGEKCIVTDWSKSSNRVRQAGEGSGTTNDNLNALALNLEKYYSKCRADKIDPDRLTVIGMIADRALESSDITISELTDLFLKECAKGIRKTKYDTNLSRETIYNYRNSFLCLKDFFATQRITRLSQISITTLKAWHNWMWKVRGYTDNFVGKHTIAYGIFAKWCEQKGHITKLPRIKVWSNKVDIYPLYPEELKLLHEWKPKSENVANTRDIFLVGCMTCLRVTNLLALTSNNFFDTGEGLSVSVIQIKVNQPLRIKLHPIAETIIRNRISEGPIFPEVTDDIFNEDLKVMVKEFADYLDSEKIKTSNKWKDAVPINTYQSGKPTTTHRFFYETVTSHVMRRTGITSLLVLGVPREVVMKLSGHRFNSKAFSRYVSIADAHRDNQTNNAWSTGFGL